ncbi:MAG TPA: nucleotidyltransferase domain-containing protein [Chryseolinea sp.]|nr:nucleotidyltransferase domain-containing protein [Chryseolinea sp.]HPM31541.1 nucleotidyltransferase domain-containing protein [Chryseolinea sp.]
MGLIETYKDQILRLCINHKVKTLYSFGSVNTTRFSNESDVDLMVDFETNDPIEYTDNYFDLKFELERILNRSIDLLENRAIKNPLLRENIDKSKVLIYGQ